MVALIRPNFWSQQPQVPVDVDWSNPLTKGLVAALLPDGLDAVTRQLFVGSSTVHMGAARSAAFNGSTDGMSVPFTGDISNGVTLFALIYPTNTTLTNTIIGIGTGVSDRYVVLDISGTEDNDPVRLIQNNGVFGGCYRSSMIDFNQWQTICGTAHPDSRNNKLYKNGTIVAATNYPAGGGLPNNTTIDIGQSTQTTKINKFFGNVAVGLAFNRILSDAEIYEINKNPYQLFKRPPSRLFIPAATGGVSLTIADATHVHAADNLTLDASTSSNLITAEALHGHAADSLSFSMDTYLAVAESLHSHAADNLTLSATGAASLVVQDAAHGHVSDGVALTTQWLLTVADALHSHSADNVLLDTSNTTFLTVQNAAHSHGTDAVGLTLDTWLAIVDAAHAHAADAPTLSASVALLIAEALHAHYADALVLSFPGETTLTPADISAIAAAVLAALNATTGTRTMGEHLQIQTAVLAGTETGAGTSHITFTDGTATVEADVPLPGVVGNRTNVVISV